MDRFELIREWETPFTKFHKGHQNDADTWADIFGVSSLEFWQHLTIGNFENWLKPINKSFQ